MPVLKCKQETVFQVDYSDFNDFVNEVYAFEKIQPFSSLPHHQEAPYNFAAAEQSSNDVSHQFSTPSPWLDREEVEQEIARFIESNGTEPVGAYYIIDDLCNKGLIEPGTYIINVSW